MAECKVDVCEATRCKYNKDKKCTLEKVMLNNRAQCIYYSEKGQKAKDKPRNPYDRPKDIRDRFKRDIRMYGEELPNDIREMLRRR